MKGIGEKSARARGADDPAGDRAGPGILSGFDYSL